METMPMKRVLIRWYSACILTDKFNHFSLVIARSQEHIHNTSSLTTIESIEIENFRQLIASYMYTLQVNMQIYIHTYIHTQWPVPWWCRGSPTHTCWRRRREASYCFSSATPRWWSQVASVLQTVPYIHYQYEYFNIIFVFMFACIYVCMYKFTNECCTFM